MKKKVLCGSLFLMVLFCISFSQTHLTAAVPEEAPSFENETAEDENLPENAAEENENLSENAATEDGNLSENAAAEDGNLPEDPSAENESAVTPDSPPAADSDGHQASSDHMPALPSGATPEPLDNKSTAEGEYTISLTTSIGTLTYYNQSDSRWANYLYGGSDPLAVYGCGPTVMAMLVTSFTEHTCPPPDMAAWAAANHYWSLGYGTKHEFIPEGASAFGLHAESFQNLTVEGMISELKNGHILVALMGPGHFSDSGHFIIITDDWSGNQVRVADPARLERTQVAWDAQLILDELLRSATGGGPVWSITPK